MMTHTLERHTGDEEMNCDNKEELGSSPPATVVTFPVSSPESSSSFYVDNDDKQGNTKQFTNLPKWNLSDTSSATSSISEMDSGTTSVRPNEYCDEYEVVRHDIMSKDLSKLSEQGSTTGSRVYVRNSLYGWVPATILEKDDQEGIATVRLEWPDPETTILVKGEAETVVTVDIGDYPDGSLPLQNRETGSNKCDLVDLEHLHEAAVLYTLQQRHADLKPYTRVRDILVAVNPFQWIDELYTPQWQDEYTERILHREEGTSSNNHHPLDHLRKEPHIYEVSAMAFRGMILDGKDQTILVTGDSGAGKTETSKILMNHLAHLSYKSGKQIVERVCQSSPVLEAFGNAKTLRNDNSSRFGKLIQMQFLMQGNGPQESDQVTSTASLVGSTVTTYLLEKTRVVSHSIGEPSYHIFYQLLESGDAFKSSLWSAFAKRTAADFSYLGHHVLHREQVSTSLKVDKAHWERTVQALELFGISGDFLQELMRAVVIVLQLGNITFVEATDEGEKVQHGSVYTTKISSTSELETLSVMMGIERVQLEESLTSSLLITGGSDGGDKIRVRASPEVAKEWCDALAKEIYSRIFGMMLRQINTATAVDPDIKLSPESNRCGSISILDIFGFERFKVNGFEQLCINYANERLHNKYVTDTFQECKEECQREDVDLYDFSHVDNSDVLELLEIRGGILESLNEECLRPGGKDTKAFVRKINRQSQREQRSSFVQCRKQHDTTFEIVHFAGSVVYSADHFVERNMDQMHRGMAQLGAECSNQIISAEFKNEMDNVETGTAASGRKISLNNKFVMQKFQAQLRSLTAAISSSESRYIRCIKPNDEFIARKMHHLDTLRQLQCSGVMTAIAMSREGYPDKLEYEVVESRYFCMFTNIDLDGMSNLGTCRERVMWALSYWLRPYMYKCGKTKVFFRAGCKERLEVLRLQYLEQAAITIQAVTRGMITMGLFKRQRSAATVIQSAWRMSNNKRSFELMRLSAIKVTACIRRLLATNRVESSRRNNAARRIQRSFLAHSKFQERTTAAKKIQLTFRRFLKRRWAATCIGHIVKSEIVRKRLRRESDAAQIIQCWTRRTFLKKQKSATTIQVAYLRFQLRRRLHEACLAKGLITPQSSAQSKKQQTIEQVSKKNPKE